MCRILVRMKKLCDRPWKDSLLKKMAGMASNRHQINACRPILKYFPCVTDLITGQISSIMSITLTGVDKKGKCVDDFPGNDHYL